MSARITYVQKACSVGETPDKRDSAPPILLYLMPVHYCGVWLWQQIHLRSQKKKSCFFLFSFCDHKRNFLPIKGSSDKSLYSLNFGLSPLH